MNIPLSPRLRVCCDLVLPGSRVADIGCDHGYLSIWLLTQGIARSAIAADINQQPLLSAVRNAEKYGVRDKMEFYLSDGAKSIPRDFDTLVCAGVGGDTMISILDAAPWLKSRDYTLILQCQSKTPMLRQYLSDNGWRICKETAVRDSRFVYTVMQLEFSPGQILTPGQCYISPALRENLTSEAIEYCRRVCHGLQLSVHSHPNHAAALDELVSDPQLAFLKEEES